MPRVSKKSYQRVLREIKDLQLYLQDKYKLDRKKRPAPMTLNDSVRLIDLGIKAHMMRDQLGLKSAELKKLWNEA